MDKSFLLKTTLLTFMLISTGSHAFEISKHSTSATATITKTTTNNAIGTKKQVTLMDIRLTNEEQKTLFENITAKIDLSSSKDDLPTSINLGMNNVPVLDQGEHGSCVTFASTAALDAAFGKGDYISQLCNLELGSYLENNGYMPSGWNGSSGLLVLNQLYSFGFINKENQKNKSCAGVTEYPISGEGNPMPLEDFKNLSENYTGDSGFPKWGTYPIMTTLERFTNKKNLDVKKVLLAVKTSLSLGDRVTFGTFLLTSDLCNDISCATYNQKHDTWALTKSIKKSPVLMGGHEMVIAGYDDSAIVTDEEGGTHKGLLVLRNSWGDEVGDKGDYYMTYDYFIKLAMEAHRILTDHNN